MKNIDNLTKRVSQAIAQYWLTRRKQTKKQAESGGADQGSRNAVTGGAQMDGFIGLLTDLMVETGANTSNIFHKRHLELPGFFRPTKEWDLLLVKGDQLVLALEAKSQVGPSFGNNFNNRTEEAMGSALDLWTAFREAAFKSNIRPWLGYFFLLEDCPASTRPVGVKEPHFPVFPEFRNSSYTQRYALFCQRLVLERQYDVAAFLTSDRLRGAKGEYAEPVEGLTFQQAPHIRL